MGHSVLHVAKAIGDSYQWQDTEDPVPRASNAGHCAACYGLLDAYFYDKTELWTWWCKRCGQTYYSVWSVVHCELCQHPTKVGGQWK